MGWIVDWEMGGQYIPKCLGANYAGKVDYGEIRGGGGCDLDDDTLLGKTGGVFRVIQALCTSGNSVLKLFWAFKWDGGRVYGGENFSSPERVRFFLSGVIGKIEIVRMEIGETEFDGAFGCETCTTRERNGTYCFQDT